MLGAYSPLAITELVQLGIDVFDTSYAYLAMKSNRALTFDYNVGRSSRTSNQLSIDLSNPM